MPLPQPPIILTREGFREWLSQLPADFAMKQVDCEKCAIAKYLEGYTRASASVGVTRYCVLVDGQHYSLEMPRWAYEFVQAFDAAKPQFYASRHLTPVEALAVLDGLAA